MSTLEKTCHFRVRLLRESVSTSMLDSNRQELFPEPAQGARSTRAGLTVVGQVGSRAMPCNPEHGAAGVRVPSPSGEQCGGAAQHPVPSSDSRTSKICSRLPLALFNIINLSGKFCSILKHTLGSKLNLYV